MQIYSSKDKFVLSRIFCIFASVSKETNIYDIYGKN